MLEKLARQKADKEKEAAKKEKEAAKKKEEEERLARLEAESKAQVVEMNHSEYARAI